METIPMADSMFLKLHTNTENGFYKKSLSKSAFLWNDQGQNQ